MTDGTDWPFRGFCLGVPKQEDYALFKRMIAEVLPEHGCNALVLLIRYGYAFESHPEVAEKAALTREQAGELAALCGDNGIRLIPKMNLLGHQSGKSPGSESGLLRAHPEFDETPDLEEVDYCRSLCPRHPDVKPIIFDLGDELIDAFGADAIHVGLDEVFEIAHCPRCREAAAHEIFAEWVNALHGHFVGERGVEMFMWGDRLLEDGATGYGKWESSLNGTAAAIDAVPNDMVICDWHYGERDDYPSVATFTGRGFRTVVCPWKEMIATEALVRFAAANRSESLLGVLATSWCDSGRVARYLVEGVGDPADEDDTAAKVGECCKRVMAM